MLKRDLHVHTTFSDGHDTAEEVVTAAIERGMDVIGFSDHSYTFFDERYCMPKNKIEEYKKEIARLKEKYRDKVTVLCGIEQDYYSDIKADGYDYIIGSVHYIKLNDEYVPVDETADILTDAAKRYFDGDFMKLVSEYYKTVSDVVLKTGASIIGHFDLISKFNENGTLFDENSTEYKNAYKSAVDNLIKTGAMFEINTGSISRGYRTAPFPSKEITEYIKSKGGKFVLSSDTHRKENLCYYFDKISV